MSATDCPTCGLDPEDFACPDPCHRVRPDSIEHATLTRVKNAERELSKLRDAVAWLCDPKSNSSALKDRFANLLVDIAMQGYRFKPTDPATALISVHEEASKQ